ncbi:rhomboid family intramembrane serine protease [Portibacter lacus]|uniref:Rhomboid family intramembrane serine protease n=1 Tax=Portibacter lacus TaxID=1099794 RepID=A0AA37STI4_9BACT|nr:rhomboid family intramembrane serine protease [Portibacter lacus]GLR17913.1 rhomboid family intramembrane serine protease [Portibacter lacus]
MMNNITDVVKNLLILNVIVFVGVSLTGELSGIDLSQYFMLYSPLSENFKPIQLVTHMFMHGGISHLLFNMLGLFFLGPYVEKRMGSQRFLIFYLACGLGALLAHIGVDYIQYYSMSDLTSLISMDQLKSLMATGQYAGTGLGRNEAELLYQGLYGVYNVPVVGASGAIYGVFLAFAMFFPNMKLMLLFPPIPIKAKFLVAGIIAIDLFSGISGQQTGIAHFAHIGGAIMGFILVSIWYGNPFKK